MARNHSPFARLLGASCALLIGAGCMGYEQVRVHDAKSKSPSIAAPTPSEPELICDRVIDDFSQVQLGSFPAGWETPSSGDLEAAQRSGSFRVVEVDGRRALHARYQDKLFTLGHGVPGWDLTTHPIVTWEWKAAKLPKATHDLDQDTAASVQAVWMVGMPFFVRTLRYTWSSGLPVGTRAEARLGHDQLVVLRSGKADLGQWRTERIDVLAQYRELFDRDDSDAPVGISLQTDADDTESQAEAYYANFRLCRPATPAPVAP